MKWIDIPPMWLLGFLAIGALLPALGPHPAWMPALGTVFVLAGLALAVWAVVEMSRARTTPIPHQRATNLVTSGPFRFSRNPIYLADLIILTGAFLWWHLWWAVPVGVLALGYILTKRFIEPEERRLREDFGVAFGDWCSKTRRWV